MAKKRWKVVTFKTTEDQATKAAKKAGDAGIGSYIRTLIAADLGEEPPAAKPGLSGASKSTKKRVSKAGTDARKNILD